MVRPLKKWLLRHRHNPYPTKAEKVQLAIGSNMSMVQVGQCAFPHAPGVNFINILRTAYTCIDPECAKKYSQVSSVIWRFWDLQM
jgi:hypothetical protein